jgi:hypothetical protein
VPFDGFDHLMGLMSSRLVTHVVDMSLMSSRLVTVTHATILLRPLPPAANRNWSDHYLIRSPQVTHPWPPSVSARARVSVFSPTASSSVRRPRTRRRPAGPVTSHGPGRRRRAKVFEMKTPLFIVCIALAVSFAIAGDKSPSERMNESISNNKIQICQYVVHFYTACCYAD